MGIPVFGYPDYLVFENGTIFSKKTSKAVVQIKDGKILNVFSSGAEAARKTNSHHSHLLECCNGKRYKTVNGFEWKFLERGNDLLEFQY